MVGEETCKTRDIRSGSGTVLLVTGASFLEEAACDEAHDSVALCYRECRLQRGFPCVGAIVRDLGSRELVDCMVTINVHLIPLLSFGNIFWL